MSRVNKDRESGRITMTTILCKAFGHMFHDSNSYGKISFGNFVKAPSMDLAVAVDVGGKDLYNWIAKDLGRRGINDIQSELSSKVKKIKQRSFDDLKKQFNIFKASPVWFLKPLLNLMKFLCYDMSISLPFGNVSKDNQGYAILTNLAGFGIENFTPPGIHFFKTVFVGTINKAMKEAVVVDGKIVVKNLTRINLWVDHRFADGADVGRHMVKFFEVLENPDKFL